MRMGRQYQLTMSANGLIDRRIFVLIVATSTLCALLALASSQVSASNVNNTRLELDGRYSFTFAADPTRNRANDDDKDQTANQSTSAMTLYKEPSSLIVNILKELFSDIDWQAIDKARVQIEKFIHKVERIVGSFRTIITKATDGGSSQASSRSRSDGRWWSSGDKKTSAAADTTNVKEMLERVACYVGYVRLMNLSNEALAELDASKVVSSLFGGTIAGGGGAAKRNGSLWSWLG